jgi:hypothetical protein
VRVIVACAQDRNGGLITRGFKGQDRFHSVAAVVSTARARTKALGTSAFTIIFLPLQLSVRSVARKS